MKKGESWNWEDQFWGSRNGGWVTGRGYGYVEKNREERPMAGPADGLQLGTEGERRNRC